MKFRVYVGTTEGPVAIERIIREAAPNSAMCIGRSTREAIASTGYEAFVKQPSGVIERELGPYSPGAFRLDVSTDIGDGDSWQLGVFVAHALAVEGRLADYYEDADAALWLTGEVANDLEVKSVGHVPDKLRASRGEFETLASSGIAVTLIVPKANQAYLDQADLPPSIARFAVSRTDEALAAAGLLTKDEARSQNEVPTGIPRPTPPADTPKRPMFRRWTYVGAAALIFAAAAAAYPYAERLWSPKSSEAQRSETGDAQSDPSTPTADEAGAGSETTQPVTAGSSPGVTEVEPRRPIGAPPRETDPIPVTEPEQIAGRPGISTPTPRPATEPETAPPRADIRLVIRERRAPSGSSCAAVHFGNIAARKVAVKRSAPDRFAPSRHDNLCGLEFTIISMGAPAYVAAFTSMISGRFVDAERAPRVLGGAIPLDGEATWVVNVARRLRGPIDYRLVAVVSDQPLGEVATRLRRRADPVAAAKELSRDALTVHHVRHLINP